MFNYAILIKSIIKALMFSDFGGVSNIIILLNLGLLVTWLYFTPSHSLIRIKIFAISTEDKFSY